MRPTLFAGALIGLLALAPADSRAGSAIRGNSATVLLRYHYTPAETLRYAFHERIITTSAAAAAAPVTTTTALVTYVQRLHIVHVSASGAATAEVDESTHIITTTRGLLSTVTKQPGLTASTMALYPDGRSLMQSAGATAAKDGAVPVFPARPIAPGAHWTRIVTRNLGSFFVKPAVVAVTEHLTFKGYGVVAGECVAVIAVSVTARAAGTAPPNSGWMTGHITTTYTASSSLAIGMSSGYLVRTVEDSTITVQGRGGTRSGHWYRLATHSEMRHI